MKMRLTYMVFLGMVFSGCVKDDEIPIPTAGPNSIMNDCYPLQPASLRLLEGVYSVSAGADFFGGQVILKNNRTGSLIATSHGKYFVIQTGYLDSVVFLQGYWRDGYSDGTGLATLKISRDEGGAGIVTGSGGGQVTIRGAFGQENGLPDQALVLTWQRAFSPKADTGKYYILAHRAGGRTSDKLPVSENSVAMINFAERLGSTGIEVDVRISKDGIPFLYHDGDLNIRLTQKGPLAGAAEDYTFAQLTKFVRLIHGELIPTLEEALTFTIDSTELRFVYLDMKETAGAMATVTEIQHRMLERAIQKGRDILIVIGIPNDDALNDLMALPGYTEIPSLCELTVDDVRKLNSLVWAPRWTLGTQNDLVQQMHDEGRLAVTWTIDQPSWIQEYITEGHFDGLLTNFPYVVAYYHYIQQ